MSYGRHNFKGNYHPRLQLNHIFHTHNTYHQSFSKFIANIQASQYLKTSLDLNPDISLWKVNCKVLRIWEIMYTITNDVCAQKSGALTCSLLLTDIG